MSVERDIKELNDKILSFVDKKFKNFKGMQTYESLIEKENTFFIGVQTMPIVQIRNKKKSSKRKVIFIGNCATTQ